MSISHVVAVGVADVRRNPDTHSELVTQALMNVTASGDRTEGEWTHVQLADYEGWIRTDQLEDPIVKGFCKVGETCGTPLELVAVVMETHVPVYVEAQGDEKLATVYLSTALPVLDITRAQRVQVALPGERTGWLQRESVAIRQRNAAYPRADVAAVTAYARKFLDRPYLWGGTSWEGIDCSGLVQLCYRMGGYILPRDGDQQHDFLPHSVKKVEMQEGDLIFFGAKQITHVALALNNREYIHAEGQNYDKVLINTFEPAAEHYYLRLDEIVWDIKRVVI
jgi:gamma-D-glutamyl-L-lysine dipeptidyl-peptidase